MLIQIFLISVLLLLLARVLRQSSVALWTKALAVIVVTVASVVVVVPDLSTRVARAFGVGRGADLITYFCIAVGAYLLTVFYLHLRNTDLRMARLVQQMALDTYRLEQLEAAAARNSAA